MANFIVEPRHETPVIGEYEVVVLGGGPAGIAAGVAAAQRGRSTIVVERYGFLGGSGTAAGISVFCGLHAKVHGEHRQVVHGVVDDLLARIARLGGLAPPHPGYGGRIQAQRYDIAAYKAAADDLVQSSGVKLYFHSLAVGLAMRSDHEIDAVLVESKSGRAAIRGRVFIDCSGDADLAAWAGAPFEKSARPGDMYYCTTMFRLAGVDPEKTADANERVPRLMEEAERRGEWQFPRKGAIFRPANHPTECIVNATQIRLPDGGPLDGTDVEQLSYGEVEGRRQAWQVYEFVRRCAAGFENAYIVDLPAQIGVRETRRLLGRYQLSVEDVMACADFSDAIGVNGWPVEAHVAGDVIVRFPPGPDARNFTQLPFRMLVPQLIDNLYVAGRCASMTHDGQSSARVSGPAYAMGQAAGTAADLALAAGTSCGDVDVATLQTQLEAAGVYLGRDVAAR